MTQLGRVLTAMATPFDSQGRVDLDQAKRLASALLSSGNDGLVVCGTTNYNTAESIDLSRKAEQIGVDAILGTVPYYNNPPQEGLYQHFKAIAAAVDLPVVLYNVPSRTVRNMEAATTLRLARDVPNIVGVKEASGNARQIGEI